MKPRNAEKGALVFSSQVGQESRNVAEQSGFTGGQQGYSSTSGGYSGARQDRFTSDWRSDGRNANQEIFGSLRILRNRSREMARNNPRAHAIFEAIVNSIVGSGTGMQSKVKMRRGGDRLNDILNQMLEDAWADFGLNCDVSGRGSFGELERLAFRTVVVSGEVLVRKVKQKFNDSEIPLGLELIMPDQLADDLSFIQPVSNGNRVFMGVEVDQWNRPVAYYIRPSHPGEYSLRLNQPEAVPADEILHIFLQEEPNQIRGLPWIYSSMIKLRDIDQYEDSLIKKARIESNIAVYMKKTGFDDVQAPADDIRNLFNRSDVDMPSGVVYNLAPGEEPVFNNSSAPNITAVDFLKAESKIAAIGAGQTYSSATGDYSENNYSQSRMEQLATLPRVLVRQAFWYSKFCNPIYKLFLEQGVLYGAIAIFDYFSNPKFYHKARWKPPGIRLQDPDAEMKAYQDGLEMGVITKTEICQYISGRDYEEVAQERSNEIYVIEEKYGLNIDPNLTSGEKMLRYRKLLYERAIADEKPDEVIDAIADEIRILEGAV
jgi:lambda family phage portal protein